MSSNKKFRSIIFYKDYFEKFFVKQSDKVKDKKKNDFYTEATMAYDDDDIFTIYLICNKLDIEYIMRLEDTEKLHSQIKTINGEIIMIESTFPWKWGEVTDDNIKNELVNKYKEYLKEGGQLSYLTIHRKKPIPFVGL